MPIPQECLYVALYFIYLQSAVNARFPFVGKLSGGWNKEVVLSTTADFRSTKPAQT